jgi:excisionase family DNA binding protein
MTRHETTEYAEGLTALLTVARLAELLSVERKTIYRLDIPFVRVGTRRRYRPEDVDAYLEARREEPAPE